MLTNLRAAPEWEEPCWVVAIRAVLGTSKAKIQQLAKKHGWDGKAHGLTIEATLLIMLDLTGKKPDFSLTRESRLLTPKTLSSSPLAGAKTGLVFTSRHVMPMVAGKLSNYNGYGDDPILVVATYEPR